MKDSLWITDIRPTLPEPTPLKESINADIAIIGGGFVGLWSALMIKERAPEKRVVILERSFCGAGASGRNGGFVSSWWSRLPFLIDLCGVEEGLKIAQASEENIEAIKAFCIDEKIDADFWQSGWIWSATAPSQEGDWDEVLKLTKRYGYSIYHPLSPAQLLKRTGSQLHRSGVVEESNATLHPAKLVRGLYRVAKARGVEIFEESEVFKVEQSSPAKLMTKEGRVTAERVIIANNVWAARLIPQLKRALIPVTSTIIATKPMPDYLEKIGWKDGTSICDSQLMINYYRTTKDDRICFGKGTAALTFGSKIPPNYGAAPSLAQETAEDFLRTYPEVKEHHFDAIWSGPIDRTYDSFPLFGTLKGAPHIAYGVGWSGNGVAPSRIGGVILSALALDEENFWTRSHLINRPFRSFPPEPFRYLGGNLVRSAVKRKERALIEGKRAKLWDHLLSRLAPVGS